MDEWGNLFAEQLSKVDLYKHKDGRLSAKKPLLLLLVLSDIVHRRLTSPRIHYSQVRDRLAALIVKYDGPETVSGPKPEQPFFHLDTAPFWSVLINGTRPDSHRQTPSERILLNSDSAAFLDSALVDKWTSDSDAALLAAQMVMEKWLPKSAWDSIQADLLLSSGCQVPDRPMEKVQTPEIASLNQLGRAVQGMVRFYGSPKRAKRNIAALSVVAALSGQRISFVGGDSSGWAQQTTSGLERLGLSSTEKLLPAPDVVAHPSLSLSTMRQSCYKGPVILTDPLGACVPPQNTFEETLGFSHRDLSTLISSVVMTPKENSLALMLSSTGSVEATTFQQPLIALKAVQMAAPAVDALSAWGTGWVIPCACLSRVDIRRHADLFICAFQGGLKDELVYWSVTEYLSILGCIHATN